MSDVYMLDTDTCVFLLRRSSETLLRKIQTVPLQQQVMSIVTYAELLYGVQVSAKKKANQAAVDALARHLAILDWSREAAEHYAQIRSDLKKKGSMIGSSDLMIAAHARSLDASLVTNNRKDFGRVRGLKIENWLD